MLRAKNLEREQLEEYFKQPTSHRANKSNQIDDPRVIHPTPTPRLGWMKRVNETWSSSVTRLGHPVSSDVFRRWRQVTIRKTNDPRSRAFFSALYRAIIKFEGTREKILKSYRRCLWISMVSMVSYFFSFSFFFKKMNNFDNLDDRGCKR